LKSLLETLRTVAFALALAVLLGAAASFAAEQTGWLRRRIQRELAHRAGEPVRLEGARVSWWRHSLQLEGLAFEAGQSELWIEDLDATLGRSGLRPTLDRVEIRGGRVELSEQLVDRIRRIAALNGREEEAAPVLPTVIVRDLQIDLAHPEWGELPLGLVDALWTSDANGKPRIEGRILPDLAQGDGPAEIFLSGHETPEGLIEITGSTGGVAVTVDTLREGTALELFRPYKPSGRLALDGSVRFWLDGRGPPSGELRAALTSATVLPPNVEAPIEDLSIELRATFEPEPGEDLTTHDAWTGVARVEASWSRAALDGWALYGRSAGTGRAARGWLHVRDLEVDADTPRRMGLADEPAMQTLWSALAPDGRASDVLLAVEMAPGGELETVLEVDADGAMQVAYHGFPDRHGEQQGVPLPVEQVRGSVLALHSPRAEPGARIAFYDLSGLHSGGRSPSGIASASGLVVSGEGPGQPSRFDIRYGARDVPIDDEVRVALTGLRGTDFIWPSFQPRGGVARAFEARMLKPYSRPGMASHFTFDFEGVGATYADLPVPASDLAGHLELVFDARRASGVSFAVAGRTPTADRIEVRGRVQDDPALEPKTPRQLREVDVSIRNVALRGVDRDALVAALPGAGRALEEVGPSGKVDVQYRTSLAAPGGVPTHRVQVTPREVQVSPERFKVRTRNARGRVLITARGGLLEDHRTSGGENGAAHGDAGAPRVEVRVQPLVGEWPGDTQVAMVAEFDGTGAGRMQLVGSGVDPSNRGLMGAFSEAFPGARGGGRAELSILDADGRVDLTGEMVLQPGAEPLNVYRIFLRDNAFGAGEGQRFVLTGLNGILEQRGNQLYGEDISAVLGSTRILLETAVFSVNESGAYRVTLTPRAQDLPLDREHMSFFLDEPTVTALIDELGWGGWVDISEALLSIEGVVGEGSGRLVFSGQVVPRDMSIDLGLPLEVDSAAVTLEQLVYENGHVRAWMDVRELDGRVADRELADAAMAVTYVEPHLSILALSGRFERGRLRNLSADSTGPFFSIDLQAPFPFELAVRLAEVDVAGLLRGIYESEFASRGVLSSELRLGGNLNRITDIHGEGRVEMRESSLWSIPVIRDLFSQLGFDQTAVFEEMRARFRLQDGVIELDPMQVKSPLLKLVGSGTLDLDGRLHQDLRVEYSLVDKLGPFTRLIYFVQNNLLTVSVRGDMARPKVVLHGALSFLQRLRGGQGRELPLPGFSPLPERF